MSTFRNSHEKFIEMLSLNHLYDSFEFFVEWNALKLCDKFSVISNLNLKSLKDSCET
jgi:hypothetical protein